MTVEELIRESIGNRGATEKVASQPFDRKEVGSISKGLEKLSSLPYKEEAYQSTCEIMKIASGSLNNTLSELDKSVSKVNELEKVAEIRQIIDEMLDTGIIDKFDVQEKVTELLEKSANDLNIVKEAIKLSSGKPSENNLFVSEKTASIVKPEKRGMFDGVIEA